ncbi:hypothetical protein DFS33DRAFT_1359925 [Desarmillaria ectypa]|nr:hypothetical protein DFS33DRAFT_1359925 [Desarmillaria ectypa]
MPPLSSRHLTDSFYIDAPHGRHLCIVTEIALCNLLFVAEKSFTDYRIPECGAKRVIRDVLSALDYVHNDCNIIHTVPQEAMPEEGLGTLIPARQHTFPVSTDNDTPVTITNSTQIVPDLNGVGPV